MLIIWEVDVCENENCLRMQESMIEQGLYILNCSLVGLSETTWFT